MEGEPKGNEAVLRALCTELLRHHVSEFCVAAGARNTPLLTALLDAPWHVVRHFFDERSAAFFALGRVAVSGRPVAVVTTSGTAVGELLPAMMEAHYRGLPLVAITADRPAHFRHSGAPQAVEQDGIFGRYSAMRWDGKYLEEKAQNDLNMGEAMARTMHFNVCLEEEGAAAKYPFLPLPDDDEANYKAFRDAREERSFGIWKGARDIMNFWKEDGSLAVLLAGIDSGSLLQAREFLLKLQAPIVAEATADLSEDWRLQTLVVQGGEKALEKLNPRRVLRIGDVPSWRWWRDLEKREDVHVLSVGCGFRGLARTVNVGVLPPPALHTLKFTVKQGSQEPAVLEDRGASIMWRLGELLDQFPKSEPAWVRHLSRLVPAGATVFLGNSLPIREWNFAAVKPKPGTRFFANRGANGIDGLISSGLGVGAEAEEAWIVVGDLSALYDMNAPWILPQLKNQKWRIVIINNGGGKIFSRVGWLRDLPETVRGVVENRHALNFEHWAKQWNLAYRRFDNPQNLADDDTPAVVWEIVPDAAQTESFWAEWK